MVAWAIRLVPNNPEEIYLLCGGDSEFYEVARFFTKKEALEIVHRLNQWEATKAGATLPVGVVT